MEPVIRSLDATESDSLIDVLEVAAGRHPSEEARVDGRAAYDPDQSLGIFDDGRLIGGGGYDLLELTLPGLVTVPAARSQLSAVLPAYRRRGLMTRMLAHHLTDIREAGVSVVVATTSSPPLPARLRYGPATKIMELTVDLEGVETASQPADRWRMVDSDETAALLPDLYDTHRKTQPGQVSRTETFWAMWRRDRQFLRIGSGPRYVAVHETEAGELDGYLTYRLEPGSLRDQPIETLVVEDLIPVRPELRTRLWRYCLDFNQARTVRAFNVAPDDPLVWTLHDRRRWRPERLRDFLWLRITRADALLQARRYAVPGLLTLDLRDDVLSDNAGRYQIHGGPDGATVGRTAASADLALDVATLASAFLGATSFTCLARAGKVEEIKPGALEKADLMFSCAAAPWCATDW